MKISDLRNMTEQELVAKQVSLKEELMQLRFQSKMGKLEKFRKLKFHIAPKYKGIITEKEVEEIYNEILRRIEWDRGKDWIESRSDEVLKQEIISKGRELADLYFKRQEWEKFVDKLTELIFKAVNNRSSTPSKN